MTSRIPRIGRAQGERGQSLVEFAIASTVLVLLFGGVIDLSRGIQLSDVMHVAARDGARYGIQFSGGSAGNPNLNDSAIKSAVDADLNPNGLPTSVLKAGIGGSPLTYNGAGCLTPSDGNAYHNPPFPAGDYPTTSGQPWLYICLTSGTQADLQVVVLENYGPLTGVVPTNLPGGFEIAASIHMKVQP